MNDLAPRRPKFHSNIVIETYNYPETPYNQTLYVKMIYNGEEIRPLGLSEKNSDIKLIDLRQAIIDNKHPERWDYIRHQTITDYINGVVPPMVKYQVPIMVFALIMILFCLNITRGLLASRKGWIWDSWCKKDTGDGRKKVSTGDRKKEEMSKVMESLDNLRGLEEKLGTAEKKLR